MNTIIINLYEIHYFWKRFFFFVQLKLFSKNNVVTVFKILLAQLVQC